MNLECAAWQLELSWPQLRLNTCEFTFTFKYSLNRKFWRSENVVRSPENKLNLLMMKMV